MDNKTPLPPLKAALEAVEVEHEGKPMVLFRDQEGLSDKGLVVSLPGFLIASLLDGRHTLSDIVTAFHNQTKQLLKEDDVGALVRQLDEAGLLETKALQEKRKQVLQDFSENPIRKPHHQKNGYPVDRLELATFLGKFFKDPKGPGNELAGAPKKDKPPLGLMAPHIDFLRGGPAYAWSYQALSESPPPDLIVGIGVAHMSPNSPWIVSPKGYDTPYGVMDASKDLFDEFKETLWYDPQEDEWVHRTEHSLEFQALWLKYIWKEKTPPWLPILCSSFERFCPDQPPSTVPTIEKALVDMGNVLRKRIDQGQRILILAAVDLGHVGPRFGGKEKLGPELEQRLEKEDKASLDIAYQLDADEMYKSVVKEGHWRKWCGLSALYTSLRLIKACAGDKKVQGQPLAYNQAPDPMGGIVSFASATFD